MIEFFHTPEPPSSFIMPDEYVVSIKGVLHFVEVRWGWDSKERDSLNNPPTIVYCDAWGEEPVRLDDSRFQGALWTKAFITPIGGCCR